MGSRIITESKTWCLFFWLILQEKQSRSHPVSPCAAVGEHEDSYLCPEIAGPDLPNTDGLTLQQRESIQDANSKYEMYIRIVSSNKCAPIAAGEIYF